MKRALLVIDVQNEYFTGKLPVSYPAGSLQQILTTMDEAEKRDIPVVIIQHTAQAPDSATFRKGSQEWALHPEIEKRPYDLLLEKQYPGSFTGTGLQGWLQSHEITTVTIAGYMTQMCCDTTARQAFHEGYGVEFLSDATGTLTIQNSAGKITDEELHRAILVTQAMRFSKVLTASEWISSLE